MADTSRAFITLFLTIFLLVGCASGPTAPLLPERKADPFQEYIVGPGDSLQIFVWKNPELSTTVPVRPDGKISSNLIDELDVAGKTIPVIANMVEKEVERYIRNPIVSVIVGGFNSVPSQQIRIIGNATNPSIITYRDGMTLLDLMIQTGGLAEFADGDNTKLIRVERGKQNTYTVQLDRLIKDGDISANRSVHPGDILIIPEATF